MVRNVTPEEFVKTWQQSRTVQEAAQRLHLSVPAVYSRAQKYRERGVKLKAMPSRRRLDVRQLNQLIGSGA